MSVSWSLPRVPLFKACIPIAFRCSSFVVLLVKWEPIPPTLFDEQDLGGMQVHGERQADRWTDRQTG